MTGADGYRRVVVDNSTGTKLSEVLPKPCGWPRTLRRRRSGSSGSPLRPHRRKERIPPGETARAAAAALSPTSTAADAVVVDLSRYAAAAAGRNTLQ